MELRHHGHGHGHPWQSYLVPMGRGALCAPTFGCALSASRPKRGGPTVSKRGSVGLQEQASESNRLSRVHAATRSEDVFSHGLGTYAPDHAWLRFSGRERLCHGEGSTPRECPTGSQGPPFRPFAPYIFAKHHHHWGWGRSEIFVTQDPPQPNNSFRLFSYQHASVMRG